jgi:ribonuclease BN (tRNA processing enzyme)
LAALNPESVSGNGDAHMKVRILGGHGSKAPGYSSTSFLVNDRLLLDAGGVATRLSIPEQLAIDDVLLTHVHWDHIAELPFLIENVFSLRRSPLRIWGPAPVLEGLRAHVFNNVLWPDLSRLPSAAAPIIAFCPLPEGEITEVAGLRVAWVQTSHPVFTAGYRLADEHGAVLFSGDTREGSDLWSLSDNCPDLRGVFMETSFPNRLQSLATLVGHMTPAMLRQELVRFARPEIPVKVFHMKPQFLAEILAELEALVDNRLHILSGGETFFFPTEMRS